MKVAISMSPKAYKAKGSRYNALHISRKTIDVVRWLSKAKLIETASGFFDRATNKGRLTRIWPSGELIEFFEAACLPIYKIHRTPLEETIILRDNEGNGREYDDTAETINMRRRLQEYNDLIAGQFIGIASLDQPWIELKNNSHLYVGPQYQQTKRVFNRSSSSKGGRFYGPWWQGCPKERRKEIRINDHPTVEVDFKSLHVALLYAKRGIDYYNLDCDSDAYSVDVPGFLQTPFQTRRYCKLLMLTAINASSEKVAFSAFRSDRSNDDDKLGASLTNQQLSSLLQSLRSKHPIIADDLCSDAGIDLMNMDSRITEAIIDGLTARRIPVLTVHDSYIVQYKFRATLEESMINAYQTVTGFSGIKVQVTVNTSETLASSTPRYNKRSLS
jgi:hypothetical protein